MADNSARPARPLIRPLFLACRPSAVARFVVPVAVDAVKGVTRRALAHVLKEGGEGMAPALADRYPASAVVLELVMTWRQASRFHSRPRVIRRRSPAVRRNAVLCHDLAHKASATPMLPAPEILPVRHAECSALTAARPCDLRPLPWPAANDRKPSKHHPGQVDKSSHDALPLCRLSAMIIPESGGQRE